MGYFPNGTAGMAYAEKYCDQCVHQHPEQGCPVMNAHLLWNYEDCNNSRSRLHSMIPRSNDGLTNEQCIFFADTRKT